MADDRTCLALILGASEFPDLPLPSNPAFANSAEEVAAYLRGQAGGPTTYRVESLFDSQDGLAEQVDRIYALLEENRDAATELLVYYVGHGAFTYDHDYFLALRSTKHDREEVTGLRSRTLAAIVNKRFARRRVFVMLDCCFAGESVRDYQSQSLSAQVERKTFEELPRQGTALLLASSKDDSAVSPAALSRTMFCEGLMTVLHDGIEDAGRHLSLADVGGRVRQVLQERFGGEAVLPEIHAPRQKAGDVSRTPLFANPAFSAATLDPNLTAGLRNELPDVRAAVVGLLARQLDDADEARRSVARAALERLMVRDEAAMVRDRAREALGVVAEPEPEREPEPEAEPAAQPVPHAALEVSATPSRRRIEPDELVTWTILVANSGGTVVRAIELTDRDGMQLREPFDLPPQERIEFETHRFYGAHGARERFTAAGTTPDGRQVAAERVARVRVSQAAPRARPVPVVPLSEIRGPGGPELAEARLERWLGAAGREPLRLREFRAALRELKVAAPLDDTALNRLIVQIEEGERHYRVATGRLAQPGDWARRVVDWNRAVAAQRGDAITLVSLQVPTPEEIARGIRTLAEALSARTGVEIPVHEFP